jgi:hypothetical protein
MDKVATLDAVAIVRHRNRWGGETDGNRSKGSERDYAARCQLDHGILLVRPSRQRLTRKEGDISPRHLGQ